MFKEEHGIYISSKQLSRNDINYKGEKHTVKKSSGHHILGDKIYFKLVLSRKSNSVSRYSLKK